MLSRRWRPMSAASDQGVGHAGARVPADQGLTSLGLLMQLAGGLFTVLCALLMFAAVLTLRNEGDHLATWGFVLLAASIVRSVHHRAAGTELLYGRRRVPLAGESMTQTVGAASIAGIRRYIVVAIAHTLLLVLVSKFIMETPTTLVLAGGAALLVWPAVLIIVLAAPRFRRFHRALPVSEDRGFEGASILMTVLGAAGICVSATMLFTFLQLPNVVLQQGPIVLVVLGTAMLLVRSVIHVQAGVAGLGDISIDRAVERANRYANFGVLSAFAAGATMLLFIVAISLDFSGLALVIAACWGLMAWPLIIRRFFSDRQFDDVMAGDQSPVLQRAPDTGLTALGWLLVAHAAMSMSVVIFDVGSGHLNEGLLAKALALGGTIGTRSAWWNTGLLVLQAWAGCELIRGSSVSRIVATFYAVIGGAVSVYLSYPMISMLRHHAMEALQPSTIVLIMPLASALVLPVATLILVNRKIAPTARARFRSTKT